MRKILIGLLVTIASLGFAWKPTQQEVVKNKPGSCSDINPNIYAYVYIPCQDYESKLETKVAYRITGDISLLKEKLLNNSDLDQAYLSSRSRHYKLISEKIVALLPKPMIQSQSATILFVNGESNIIANESIRNQSFGLLLILFLYCVLFVKFIFVIASFKKALVIVSNLHLADLKNIFLSNPFILSTSFGLLYAVSFNKVSFAVTISILVALVSSLFWDRIKDKESGLFVIGISTFFGIFIAYYSSVIIQESGFHSGPFVQLIVVYLTIVLINIVVDKLLLEINQENSF